MTIGYYPKSYQEYFYDPSWQSFMQDEFNSLQQNETWELVPLPPKRRLVQCKWMFRTKHVVDHSDVKYKAILVYKGYSQVQGVDYINTFAPASNMDSIRLVLAIAASKGWELHHMDVKSAFLHGELQEDIYMQQPKGLQEDPSIVCRLNKSLYGLKQAPGLGMQKWMLYCSQLVSFDANLIQMCICRKMMLYCKLLYCMYMTY